MRIRVIKNIIFKTEIMDCPNCKEDLSELETYDNINKEHNCIFCNIKLYLDYEEICSEDYEDCWDLFYWSIVN